MADPLTAQVIGLAIEVHRHLGPGLLESAYEECLAHELRSSDVPFARQTALPIIYKGVHLDAGYRLDLVIAGKVVIEVKAVEKLMPIHDAQLLTYLRLSGMKSGLLLNFHSVVLKDGIRRMNLPG